MKDKKEWKVISKEVRSILNEKKPFDKNYFDEYIKNLIEKRELYLESAKRFGTPQYIVDENELEKRAKYFMEVFRKELPNIGFFYPFKSNDLPLLINILKNLGFNADVAGIFELKLALKMGFEKIIFSSPGKDEEELKLAIKNRDRVIISIDNLDELERVIKTTDELRVSFRLSPKGRDSAPWSKFGLNLSDFKKGLEKIKNSKLRLIGIHFHSSWNETPDSYVENIELIGNFLREHKINLEFLDIGGGFFTEAEGTLFQGTPKGKLLALLNNTQSGFDGTDFFVEDPKDISIFAKEIAKAINKYTSDLPVYCEPGRFITKHSTRILTRVLAIKEKGCIIDAGTNTLIGENSLAEYEYAPVLNLSNPSLKLNKFHIYGSLCAPYDIWGYQYNGSSINRGDILAILNQGAYTFSYAQRFIKPIAPYIILTKDNKLICAKEKEDFKDRYGKCKLDF